MSCTLHFLYSKFLVISTLQKVFIIVDFKIAKKKMTKLFEKGPPPQSRYFERPGLTLLHHLHRFRSTFHQLRLPPSEKHECPQSSNEAENEIKYQFEMHNHYRETNSRSASRGIVNVLCKPKTQHQVHHTCHCPSHESEDSSPCLWNPLTFKPSCFTVYPASQYNFHSTYPAYPIWWTVQIWWSSLLTPPAPSVVSGPNIPSRTRFSVTATLSMLEFIKGKPHWNAASLASFSGHPVSNQGPRQIVLTGSFTVFVFCCRK